MGDKLDLDKINAGDRNGVLRLESPIAERAKPRKISITATEEGRTGQISA